MIRPPASRAMEVIGPIRGTGLADEAFVGQDNLIFAAGSSSRDVQLNGDRTASAVRFSADYRLSGGALRVLSGNVTVTAGVTAEIASTLEAESADHSLRKLGPGTLLVHGTTGQTVVQEEALFGNGTVDHISVKNQAKIPPGAASPGTSTGLLEITHGLVMESGATLLIEIGGTEPGVEYDQLILGGVADTDQGTLDVQLIDQFQPGAGDSFAYLVANLGFGGYAEVHLPALEQGWEWLFNPGGITASLNVVVSLPGHYNADGRIDAGDFTVWRDTLGGAVVRGSFADGNASGIIDEADFTTWQHNFGASPVVSTVPEPTAIGIVLFGLGCSLVTRFARHRRGLRT